MNRRSRPVRKAVFECFEPRRLFTAAAPVVDSIGNYNVPIGKTLQIPVTATCADAVAYSIKNKNPQVIVTLHPSTNTFVQMDVAGYAQPMVFELFNDIAPDTVRRFTGLVNAGYYNGLTFNSVINNFEIQGGSPDGTRTGGPEFTFDDEFSPSAIFSGTGQLAMANSGKDTNGSQFFITEGPQRLLDFNNAIFGQLVRGESTRDAISNVAVDGSDAPLTPVTITDVKVIQDTTDAVLQVQVNNKGSYSVRVTGTSVDGSDPQTITLTGKTDIINDPPILGTLPSVYYTAVNTPIQIQLTSTDIEGDSVYYQAQQTPTNFAGLASTSSYDHQTGVLTIVPVTGFAGEIDLEVGVQATANDNSRGSTTPANSSASYFNGVADTQLIKISVGGPQMKVTGYGFDTTQGNTISGVTVATFRTTDPTALATNFNASIDWGDGTVSAGTIRKNRSGSYSVYGTQAYAEKALGALPLTVTVTGPDGATATGTTTATVHDFASLSSGVLAVYGTSGNDRIGVGRSGAYYSVTVNKQTENFAVSDVTLITVYGLDGNDSITVMPMGVIGSYLDGGNGNDTINGGEGNDTINGGAGNDLLYGNDGDDKMAGVDGDDTLYGGNGKDHITGGNGNDFISGDAGHDFLSGNNGNDTLLGGGGADNLYGNDGNDVLNGMAGADTLDGGIGTNLTKSDPLDVIVGHTVTIVK